MKVIKLVVGQLKTNCFLVFDEKTRECLIIDPGDDADYIMRKISDEDLRPVKIVATHGHFDHILAAYEIQHAFNIPFLMHKNDEFLLERMQSSAKHFTGIIAGPPPVVNEYLTGVTPVTVKKNFEVIETPGHTPGGIVLYCKKEKIAFVGDLVFASGGVGRTDFAYSSKDDLEKSIKKVISLPRNTKLYCGHGKDTKIGKLREYLY